MPSDRSTRDLWLSAVYLALSALFCAPLFREPHALGISDWDVHLFYHGSLLQSVLGYGQAPFWNPWYCGGNVLWQNPQVWLLSPVYLLAPVMSLALAMKITIVLHYWIGFVGMHLLLTRVIGLTYWPLIVYLASVFTLSGAPALHLNAGHSVFLPAFYLPLLLFFFLRGLKADSLVGGVRDALAGAVVLALTIYNGGLHIVAIALTLVGLVSVVAAALRQRWQPLAVALTLSAAAFAYAAPKLLPVALFVGGPEFWDTRPVTVHPDGMTRPMVVRAYVDPYQTRSLRADGVQRHGWYEYGNYIGSFAVILALGCGLWVFTARSVEDRWLGLSLVSTGLALLLFSAGEFSAFAPASWAVHLPLFSSFRIPARYTITVALVAAVTIAWVLKAATVDRTSGKARLLVGLLCTLAAAQLLVTNRAQFEGVFPVAPLERGFSLRGGPTTLELDRTTSAYAPTSPMLRALANGKSFYNCYEPLQLRHTADSDHPLVFSDGKSRVFETRFSPNRIQFSVAAGAEPSRVALNQNFAAGWSSTAGPLVRDPHTGMPTVILRPGQAGTFAFVFVPPGLWTGTIVLVVALIASVAVWRRRPRASGT